VKVPIELVGCEVWRTTFDYQVRLTLVAHDSDGGYRVNAELVIETPFLMREESGEWHEIDPGNVDTLAPALRLFMRTVDAVEVGDRGALSIELRNGSGLFIGPDTTYESWTLSGHGVESVVVGPGGHDEWQR